MAVCRLLPVGRQIPVVCYVVVIKDHQGGYMGQQAPHRAEPCDELSQGFAFLAVALGFVFTQS